MAADAPCLLAAKHAVIIRLLVTRINITRILVIKILVIKFLNNYTNVYRRVEQLAALLAPLIAPLAGRAVDIASAAYLARTLSRQPSEPWHAPASTSPDQRAPSGEEISTGGSGSSGIRRMATESWILSIG